MQRLKGEHIFISRSPAETEALGERWGHEAQPGWVIGLTGDLGAGKTQLAKGIARGLGYGGKVQSPTFALINEYKGTEFTIFHIDLYRLENRQQIVAAGLEEFLYNPPGISVIEWIERWTGQTPQGSGLKGKMLRLVKIATASESERRITYEDFGA